MLRRRSRRTTSVSGKRLLEYDDVMNSQRTVIYSRRRNALAGERIDIDRNNIVLDFAETFVENFGEAGFEDFSFELIRQVAVQPSFDEQTFANAKKEELVELIAADINDAYERRAQSVAATAMPFSGRCMRSRATRWRTFISPSPTASWSITFP